MVRFSVVMPIHNEEKNLAFSLPSVFKLGPDEVILIFDRCTDRSHEVATKLAEKFDYDARTRFIELNEPSPKWNYRVAFLFRYGYENTKNENILATAADVVFDSRVKHFFDLIGNDNIKLISFGLKHYPLNFQYFVRRLICVFFPQRAFSGVFLFSKSAWLETEDEGSAKRIFKAQDTHLRLSIQKKV